MNLTTCQNRARDLERKPWHSKRMSHPILCHGASTSPWLGSLKLSKDKILFSEFWVKTNELVTFYPVVNMPLGLSVVEPVHSVAAIKTFFVVQTLQSFVPHFFLSTLHRYALCQNVVAPTLHVNNAWCHLLRLYVRAAGMWIFQAASLEPNDVSFGPASSKSNLYRTIVEIPKKK